MDLLTCIRKIELVGIKHQRENLESTIPTAAINGSNNSDDGDDDDDNDTY